MTTIAHVSDLHLNGTPDRRARTERVAAHLRALTPRPDVVLVTGDVADHGRRDEYAEAADALAGLDPLVIPGNHDDRAAQSAVFGPPERVHRTDGTTFALCDTLVPGHGHGELSVDALTTLDGLVDEPGPLVVALHHPPMPVGHPSLDRIALREPDALAAVLRRCTGPTLILCGHLHLALSTTFAGHPLVVAPGVSSTLRTPDEPGDALVRDESEPGFALHVLTGDAPALTLFRTPLR